MCGSGPGPAAALLGLHCCPPLAAAPACASLSPSERVLQEAAGPEITVGCAASLLQIWVWIHFCLSWNSFCFLNNELTFFLVLCGRGHSPVSTLTAPPSTSCWATAALGPSPQLLPHFPQPRALFWPPPPCLISSLPVTSSAVANRQWTERLCSVSRFYFW